MVAAAAVSVAVAVVVVLSYFCFDTEYLQCARYLMDSFMRHVVLCCGRLAYHILVMSAIVMRAAGACDSGI